MFKSIDPYRQETISEFQPDLLPSRRVLAADAAFNEWSRLELARKKDYLLAFARVLESKKQEYATTISREMGKRLVESLAEVDKCITTTKFYAEEAQQYLAPVPLSTSADRAWSSFEPLGSKRIEELISDPRIKGVTLTGSGPAGASVAGLAGKYLKKTVLELGGSDPFVVLKDADVAQAATVAVQSRFQNAGQTCIAAKRWIVEKEVYPEFKDKVVSLTEQLRVGDPFSAATTLAPVARLDLAETLEGQLETLAKLGAKPLLSWKRDRCLFSPQVLEVDRRTAANYQEELFGPIGMLIQAESSSEAIAIANETPFGLGASLWTRDTVQGQHLMQQIKAGAVFMNGMVKSEGPVPFGGIGESGYGRELGPYGMHEFANIKSNVIANDFPKKQ